MLQSATNYLKQSLSLLNPFAPFGDLLLSERRWQLSDRKRYLIAAICYSLSLLGAYVLFYNYTSLLSPHNLLTANTSLFTKALLLPVISLAICAYMLSLGLTFARTSIPIYVLPLVFIIANEHHFGAYLGGLILFAAFGLYYLRFNNAFYDFKQPSLIKIFGFSIGFFTILVSLAITISYYSGFSTQITTVGNRLSDAFSKQLIAIYVDASQEIPNETLRTRAIHSLKLQDQSVTPEAIKKQEQTILVHLGLKTANQNDDYRTLLEQAILKQITTTINNYKELLNIVAPLAFFFVTSTLTGIACNLAWLLLAITERVTLRKATSHPI